MSAPIPREVLAIIEAQQAALAKVAPKHRDRLLAIALEVQRALEARLKALAPERYTTQEVRVLLTQVRAVVELLGVELGKRMGNELRNIGEVAAKIGRDGLVDQVAAWADKFQGSVRRIAPAEVAGDLLDEGLLEYYESSKQTYGLEAIAKMRGALAKSVLEGKTVAQASEALTAAVELQDWRAERIVRTEQSFATHRRQIEDLKQMWGDEANAEWGKQLIAVHDDRTGRDSKFVDLQIQRLDDPFWDGTRHYQHPPNRPNDRETLVFVPIRDVERFEALARDPAHGGVIGPKSRREAQVALGVERAIERGAEYPGLKPPLHRSPDPQADFIDASGQAWDVKGFTSYPRSGEGGGYKLDHSIAKIRSKLARGVNVILDTTNLSPTDLAELRNEVDALRFGGRVVYFPA